MLIDFRGRIIYALQGIIDDVKITKVVIFKLNKIIL